MKQTPVTQEQLTAWSENYNGSEKLQLATLALSKTDINAVTYVSKASFAMRQKFSIDIPTLDVTNQQSSGRCWLFAATNVLRERIAKELNLENFELSQSYLAFWDKFARRRPHRGLHSSDRRARRRPVGHVRQHRGEVRRGAQGRV